MDSIFYKYDDLFIHNEYFDKYVELCSRNRLTKKSNITQCHHIIPVSYFKNKNLPTDNSKENKVQLKISDHIIAHYYLCLCIDDSNEYVRNSSACMVFLNTNIDVYSKIIPDFENIIGNLNLEQIYSDAKNYIRESRSGTTYINNGNVCFPIKKDDLDKYLSMGYSKGFIIRKVSMVNGSSWVYVDMSDVEKYEKLGYRVGHPHKTSQIVSGYKTIHNGDLEKRVPKEQVSQYIKTGWELGRSRKSVESILRNFKPTKYKGTKGIYKGTCTGTVFVNNGETSKRIKKDEIDLFLKDNPEYSVGSLKYSWMTNDLENVKVFTKLDEQKYIGLGYKFGMMKRKPK